MYMNINRTKQKKFGVTQEERQENSLPRHLRQNNKAKVSVTITLGRSPTNTFEGCQGRGRGDGVVEDGRRVNRIFPLCKPTANSLG